ncbi:flavin reductase [Janibacter cremeus]|uniref:flavin reductase n=1 Tax=Janibacter cremeus TaxID=1285192 RepID=UPI0023F6F05E|nr:flavin reductase [Janibacter cremeus]WEV77408.1 flavin reductase [Janibacter cremeus]
MTQDQQLERRFDAATFREVLGHYPTGVVVVTGVHPDGDPVGMVVGTFSSVSLEPAIVSFMPGVGSGTYARLRECPALVINVLAHDQTDVCRTMAIPADDKFDHVGWQPSSTGAPVLDDAVAIIHCRLDQEVLAGDHYITLCAVDDLEIVRPVTPLLFFQGGYGGFNPKGLSALGDGDFIEALRLAETARPHIRRLADRYGCEAAVLTALSEDEMTTADSAYAGTAEVYERLGERIPLIPPIGDVYVAHASQEVQDAWCAKAPADEEVQARYRRRLETVRRDGYSVVQVGAVGAVQYARMHEALEEYASGPLTPSRERAVREVLSEMSDFFEPIDICEDTRYDLGSIMVPVFDPGGTVAMVLRLTQLPQGASAHTVRGWLGALQEAAAEVSTSLRGGESSEVLQAYRSWFMM